MRRGGFFHFRRKRERKKKKKQWNETCETKAKVLHENDRGITEPWSSVRYAVHFFRYFFFSLLLQLADFAEFIYYADKQRPRYRR